MQHTIPIVADKTENVPIASLCSIAEWKAISKGIKDNNTIVNALRAVYSAVSIQDKLDRLYDLIKLTNFFIHNKSNLSPKLLSEIIKLQNSAIIFAGNIIDTFEPQEILRKLQDRQRFKQLDPSYMPWHKPISSSKDQPSTYIDVTDTKNRKVAARKLVGRGILNQLRDVSRGVTEYGITTDEKYKPAFLNEREREALRVIPNAGRFVRIKIKGTGENSKLVIENFSANIKNRQGQYRDINKLDPKEEFVPFVISIKGDIFVDDTEPVWERDETLQKHFHTSILGPRTRIMFAGTLVCADGKLMVINDMSGHFQPGYNHTDMAMHYMKECCVINGTTKFSMMHTLEDALKNPNLESGMRGLILRQLDPSETKKPFPLGAKIPVDVTMPGDLIRDVDPTNIRIEANKSSIPQSLIGKIDTTQVHQQKISSKNIVNDKGDVYVQMEEEEMDGQICQILDQNSNNDTKEKAIINALDRLNSTQKKLEFIEDFFANCILKNNKQRYTNKSTPILSGMFSCLFNNKLTDQQIKDINVLKRVYVLLVVFDIMDETKDNKNKDVEKAKETLVKMCQNDFSIINYHTNYRLDDTNSRKTLDRFFTRAYQKGLLPDNDEIDCRLQQQSGVRRNPR